MYECRQNSAELNLWLKTKERLLKHNSCGCLWFKENFLFLPLKGNCTIHYPTFPTSHNIQRYIVICCATVDVAASAVVVGIVCCYWLKLPFTLSLCLLRRFPFQLLGNSSGYFCFCFLFYVLTFNFVVICLQYYCFCFCCCCSFCRFPLL